MANALTGEFDVVAQFSVPAVARLLAAMHGIKRFPHSLSLRIDDRQRRPERVWPTTVEIIDIAGESVVDPHRIQDLWPPPPAAASLFDNVVNHDWADVIGLPPLVPSLLHGRAQLQLAPPTLEIVDGASSRIRVRMRVRARYFPDPQTPPLAEFVTGEVLITTAVSQITSQAGRVVEIDLRGNAVQAVFEPSWSSQALSAADLAAINRLITNTLRSSVLPSNTALPADIEAMTFKAFSAPAPAIAALLNMATPAGNPASAQRVFLGGADFAFAVGADALQASFKPALDQILSTPIPPFEVSITGPNPTYHVTLRTVELALRSGRMLLILKGRARTPAWYAPNFDFTVTQVLTLQPQGTTAELVVGPITLDTTSWIVNRFRGAALDKLRPIRDRALAQSDAAGKVRRILDTERTFGGLLRSLLTPARPDGQPTPPALGATLSYTSADIETDGILLRGTLSLADWGPAHVEFEEIAPTSNDPLGGWTPSGPEYSAFKSWIAGGVVDSFEWKRAFQTTPGFVDDKRFVKLPEKPGIDATDSGFEPVAPGAVTGYRPMCLTITGRRLSAAGPISSQPVQATYCAFNWFPLFDVALVDAGSAPMAALSRPGPNGSVEIVGHAPAVRDDKARATPNLVVHFGTAESAGRLHHLLEALGRSGRGDAPTAVVAVLDRNELSRAPYVDGVVYAESDERWAKTWNVVVERRPFTVVIDASGKPAWQHAGDLDPAVVVDVLRRVLRPSRFAGASMVRPGVRIGQLPPNFVFTYAPGHELTLRKLTGRPVILVFSRSGEQIGPGAQRGAATVPLHAAWQGAIVLNIHFGDATSRPVQEGARVNDNVTDVPDRTRTITQTYGIVAWPTTVYIDARGVVRDVRHGDLDNAVPMPPPRGDAADRG